MIQPILSNNINNNINFSGHLNIKTRNNGDDVNAVYGLIPEPERDEFIEQIDGFKESFESSTDKNSEFTLVLDKDDWFVGGGCLKRGKAVIFELLEGKGLAGKRLFGSQIPMVKEDGELWHNDDEFASQLKKFLKTAKQEALGRYMLWQAMDNAGKVRKPRPIFQKDGGLDLNA